MPKLHLLCGVTICHSERTTMVCDRDGCVHDCPFHPDNGVRVQHKSRALLLRDDRDGVSAAMTQWAIRDGKRERLPINFHDYDSKLGFIRPTRKAKP